MNRTDTINDQKRRGMFPRLLSYLKPLRGKYIFSLFCLSMLALMDSLYPIMLKEGIDRYVTPGNLDGVVGYVLIYVILISISTTFVFLGNRSWGRVWAGMAMGLRDDLFTRMEALSVDYYDTARSGWIVERFMRDVDTIAHFPTKFVQQRGDDAFRLIFFSVAMLALEWRLGLILIGFIPLVIGALKWFGNIQFKSQRASRQQSGDMTAFFSETVMGAKSIKALELEPRLTREFVDHSSMLKRIAMRLVKVDSLYDQTIYLLGAFALAVVFTVGTNFVMNASVTVGTLTAFIAYATALYASVTSLAAVGSRYQNCKASMERYFSLLDQPVTVYDTPEVEARYPDEASIRALPKLKGGLAFEDVHFAYTNGQAIFHGLNLSIESGQTIALVGETGGGKTTLVNLACRFYQPTRGRILLDGVDYKELSLQYIYRNLGYVLQSPHLFTGSVMENIRYGRLDATDDEVKAASEMVHADEFVDRMEHGYDSDVGEGGNLLSAGERQLVSFARALLADPAILVLDEATASVDSETEMLVQRATARLIAGRTTFIIAHRLSTARGADRILVVDAGEVIEDGSHDALMAAQGAYYKLNLRQHEAELLV